MPTGICVAAAILTLLTAACTSARPPSAALPSATVVSPSASATVSSLPSSTAGRDPVTSVVFDDFVTTPGPVETDITWTARSSK